jgi:hypothetical protein
VGDLYFPMYWDSSRKKTPLPETWVTGLATGTTDRRMAELGTCRRFLPDMLILKLAILTCAVYIGITVLLLFGGLVVVHFERNDLVQLQFPGLGNSFWADVVCFFHRCMAYCHPAVAQCVQVLSNSVPVNMDSSDCITMSAP